MTNSNELRTFNFHGLELRITTISGEPWFVTRDAARALNIAVYPNGHIETAEVTRLVSKEEKQLLRRTTPHLMPDTAQQLFQRKQPSLSIISESGLYKLIMRSDKPEARKFQDWVTREVLPAICKTRS